MYPTVKGQWCKTFGEDDIFYTLGSCISAVSRWGWGGTRAEGTTCLSTVHNLEVLANPVMQSAWLPCLGRHAIRFWCNRNQMSLERFCKETMVYRQIVCLTLICNWFSRGSIPTKVEYFSNSLVVVVRTQPSNVKYFRNDPKISTLSG